MEPPRFNTYLLIHYQPKRKTMITDQYLRGFWLYYVYQDARHWAKFDTRSFNRDRSGLLEAERVKMAKEGLWCKPDVKSWIELDAEYGELPVEPPISGKVRERFTRYLTQTLEAEGLVEIQRASNRRIAWVRLTPAGEAEAVKLNPALGDSDEEMSEGITERPERIVHQLELQIEKAKRHMDWLRGHMDWLRKRDGSDHPRFPEEWKEFQRDLKQTPTDIKRFQQTLERLRAGNITPQKAVQIMGGATLLLGEQLPLPKKNPQRP